MRKILIAIIAASFVSLAVPASAKPVVPVEKSTVHDKANDVKYEAEKGFTPGAKKKEVDIRRAHYSFDQQILVVRIKTAELNKHALKNKDLRWYVQGKISSAYGGSNRFVAFHETGFDYSVVDGKGSAQSKECKVSHKINLKNNTVALRVNMTKCTSDHFGHLSLTAQAHTEGYSYMETKSGYISIPNFTDYAKRISFDNGGSFDPQY